MTDHVAYGSIVLDSPARQSGLMFVGTDDSVKVWLNGKLVHENLVLRPAGDYQDVFRVTLKKGKNILLVSVYEHLCCGWSGFFGFESFMAYKVLPPRGLIPDVNKDGKINASDLLVVVKAINFSKFRKDNPQTDVNKDGAVNIADLELVIDYLDNPITGAAPSLQNAVSHPSRKLATAWAKLKMR